MSRKLTGACLCGQVNFSVEESFGAFYQCHCQQCRQLTGSAFASNLFTRPDNITWLSGKQKVTQYEHPSRAFSKAFCGTCGSALPFVTKSGKSLIVPAGSLLEPPTIQPQANIFMQEKACWLESGAQAKRFEGFEN